MPARQSRDRQARDLFIVGSGEHYIEATTKRSAVCWISEGISQVFWQLHDELLIVRSLSFN
jgi:hypothetical protein